ncbi:MAG TPA: aminomethyl-transferring glycine dehydrogenase [Candidatus Methylacidiphilales bacterium]|jgi:glycine dehydrogenase|nr:aminomethyl-transferring glycine dehydrogenase [Candidatus Methylacidiphilales bacterium]
MLEAQTAPIAATFPTPPPPETPSAPPLKTSPGHPFAPLDTFARRHIGPQPEEIAAMLKLLGHASLDDLAEAVVPPAIHLRHPLDLPAPKGEREALEALRAIMDQNKVFRSFIGQGYYDTITPPVIQRNILENPGWYTAYTPYQAEIAQGRLEALLNFQTMVADLTGLDIANASLLDEATAAAEAMTMLHAVRVNPAAHRFFVSNACHPQTLDVLRTRAAPQGVEVVIDDAAGFNPDSSYFGALLQYPDTHGAILDYTKFIQLVHQVGGKVAMATDLLALTLLKPPGEFGVDVAVGSAQRFGVPLGYGGPHAAFFATKDELKRHLPGRLIGVSHDPQGRPAMRLALQTREQHIRRDKATSNICTAQVLLAVMASMYAVYHGPEGLREIAGRVHRMTAHLGAALVALGYKIAPEPFFDTLRITTSAKWSAHELLQEAVAQGVNLRLIDADTVTVSLDETATAADLDSLLKIFGKGEETIRTERLLAGTPAPWPAHFRRTGPCLTHPVFNTHHTETEMLRYIRRLESRDLSLCNSMIPLGSCTMKLNAAAEMFPVSWPTVARLHPFAPIDQARGYQTLFRQLESWLAEITGMAAVSLQPNAGSQGEYAGLLAIRAYHQSRGDEARRVCLIPVSAHGTNPASAVMAGMKVVPVACDAAGNIDIADLRAKADQHVDDLACAMITYPSTHGAFEDTIVEAAEIIHSHGGQVYMDGANLTAQLGLCRPGDFGMDVCHLNLHKTFCIPHGGGGPGVGPIAVAPHLADYLPGHAVIPPGESRRAEGAVSAAPWGSAGILVISWMYIAMLGAEGLKQATQTAILNANYMAAILEPQMEVLYRGHSDLVAHEFILDVRSWKQTAGIEVEDIAKRLIDYGFHAPTISFPVPGTMMIEPTESESKEELDRFCVALIAIHGEMRRVASGEWPRDNNPLKLAPHTAAAVSADAWDRPYSRELAAYPVPWLREHKFWPSVGRIDNVYGDRNLVCSCPPIEAYQAASQ